MTSPRNAPPTCCALPAFERHLRRNHRRQKDRTQAMTAAHQSHPGRASAGVTDTFSTVFGRRRDTVWSAPGRVNLLGEHVDYNGGPVLPFAIQQRSYVAAATQTDGVVRLRSEQFPGELVEATLSEVCSYRGRAADVAARQPPHSPFGGWSAYVLGVIWALSQVGVELPGLDIVVDGHVPVGAGLSSSAALECAATGAFADLAGVHMDRAQRARVAQHAENEFVGVPCGLMDQMASTCAQSGHALLFDTLSGDTEQIPLDPSGAGYSMLVVDTGAAHGLVDGEYATRRAACEEAARLLGVGVLGEVATRPPIGRDAALASIEDPTLRRRARHVLSEIARVQTAVEALRAGDWVLLGLLMDASHDSLRDDFEVSSPQLDWTVGALRSAGALGARLTGAGFGGSVVALVASCDLDGATAAVERSFASMGFSAPHSGVAVPSEGARRDSHTP